MMVVIVVVKANPGRDIWGCGGDDVNLEWVIRSTKKIKFYIKYCKNTNLLI